MVVPGRCEGRDAGVSTSLGDSTDSSWKSLIFLALNYEKLCGIKEMRSGTMGGVRLTEFAVRFPPALLLCSLFDLHLWIVQGTFS